MRNEEYTSDEGKRRREDDKEDEIFSRSKRIVRTPQKPKSNNNDDKMDKMMEMMQTMMQEIKEIRIEHRNYQEEMNKLREQNEQIKKDNEKLKTEMKIMHSKLEDMDRDKRRNNVVVSGLDMGNIQQDVLEGEMKKFFRKNMDIEPELKTTKKIGAKTYLIELGSVTEKIKVMRNKSKLRNYTDERVYINDDMTRTQREIQEKLRTVAREERKMGKSVREGFQKLIIDNVQYRWNDERGNIEKSKPKN